MNVTEVVNVKHVVVQEVALIVAKGLAQIVGSQGNVMLVTEQEKLQKRSQDENTYVVEGLFKSREGKRGGVN